MSRIELAASQCSSAKVGTPLTSEAIIERGDGGPLLRAVDYFAAAILAIALCGELAVVLTNVAGRALSAGGLLWTGEVAQFALSVLTFVGGVVAYRRLHHLPVRALTNRMSPQAQAALAVLAEFLVLLGAVVAGVASIALVQSTWNEQTPILRLPAATIALPLCLGMLLLALYAFERLMHVRRRLLLAVGLPLAAILIVAALTHGLWFPLVTPAIATATVLLLFVVTVLAGLPVGFALILAAAGYLWVSSSSPMVALPQNMVNGTGNYVLLAVPFFVLAGLIMERGGLSLRLVRFVQALAGHLRGGLLQVVVVSMYLVSGLSGSKAADVAAVGSVMRDMLAREGYSAGEGAAVLAASAAMGETVPPSIAMLVLGSITSLSIAALFIGGLIPAAVIGLCLMLLIYIRARISNAPRAPRASFKTLREAALGAILPLLLPLLLFGGIMFGIATPTEISSFAVLYGAALALFVYREMGASGLMRTVIDSAALSGMVLFILAAASAFSWVLTIASLPQALVELLHHVNNSSFVFLIGSILLLVVAGSLLEGLPALNVLAPLLLPVATQIGISPLHYGIVLVIAMGIGAFMPPAGVGFYVCCAIQRTEVELASRAMLPYLVVLLVGLLVVAFVPALTLVLPHAFGLH
jgi:tripartite ATP-independent transporter DctM subunit